MNKHPPSISPRRSFLDALSGALAATDQSGLVGVLVLRIPRIHEINVNYGYDVSDQVVGEVQARIAGAVRECDTVERVEDAGFALVLPRLQGSAQAELAAAKIIQACKSRFLVGGHDITVQVSIGVALYPSAALDAEGLLRCAELALVQANGSPIGYGLYSCALEKRCRS